MLQEIKKDFQIKEEEVRDLKHELQKTNQLRESEI